MTELLTYRNFKVGVEDFEKLITQKLVYIDKTSYLENLVKRAHVAQVLRPRRTEATRKGFLRIWTSIRTKPSVMNTWDASRLSAFP